MSREALFRFVATWVVPTPAHRHTGGVPVWTRTEICDWVSECPQPLLMTETRLLLTMRANAYVG